MNEHNKTPRQDRGEVEQRAQGDMVPGCEDCAHNGRFLCDTHGPATQPPHQDRGEVELALLRVAEMLPPKPFGQYVQPGFVMGDKHCRELHARFESLSATITAALTEAKQQCPACASETERYCCNCGWGSVAKRQTSTEPEVCPQCLWVNPKPSGE